MLREVKSPRHPASPAGLTAVRQAGRSPVLKEIALCGLSAILLILSFPSFNLEFLAWFGFVPVFFALNNKSQKQVFFLFFITGIIFWSGIVYWLVYVTLAGTIVLILYLALYFAIFGLIISSSKLQAPCLAGRQASSKLLFIPSVWVLLEYIRSHLFTGFPWALLGYSQYLNLPVVQIADITGIWGVSFLVMMSNVALYLVMSSEPGVRGERMVKSKNLITPVIIFCFVLGYGFYKLQTLNSKLQTEHAVKISVIQGNIPQELKWDAKAQDYIINEYLDLNTRTMADKPDLIIWPESALPVILEGEPDYFIKVTDFVNKNNIPLLLGVVRLENELYYNSALLISEEAKSITKYDKLHLVPFGEYIPLRKTLSFLETIVPIGDFTPGKEYSIFKLRTPNSELPACPAGRQANFSVLICFEDLFPELSREFRKRGADFLVNITNDAWFKKTSSPYQHLSASVFRAVENRVFLARAANTGVSGFIAPSGKIVSLVRDDRGNNIFISGYDTEDINVSKSNPSFYTRFGDIFLIACLLFVLYDTMRSLKSLKLKT
ncbi:MAG: apolipoprotein N-acyltransferase [Candidatus Omnitrophica bacterium]|nr:apolipoprotein N-acyltransferase [Candidatus Omnitrophota bacterium]